MVKKFNPGGIRIDGSGDDHYEDEVYNILDQKINHNPAGKIILEWIEENPHFIWIVPMNSCSPETDPDVPRDAHPKDELYFPGYKPLRPNVLSKTPGTGAGSDAHIKFSPGKITQCVRDGKLEKYGSKPEEALFHELIHGLRMNQGVENARPMPSSRAEDEEEFLAITAGDIYMSADSHLDTGLRDYNYQGMFELKYPLTRSPVVQSPAPPLSVAILVDPDYREVLTRLAHWPPMFHIADIPEADAPFNPFREIKYRLARYLLLKPNVDYVKQYNHMVYDLEWHVVALKSSSLSLEERRNLQVEKEILDGMIKRWPDGNNGRQ
jgi:hypothetical protein